MSSTVYRSGLTAPRSALAMVLAFPSVASATGEQDTETAGRDLRGGPVSSFDAHKTNLTLEGGLGVLSVERVMSLFPRRAFLRDLSWLGEDSWSGIGGLSASQGSSGYFHPNYGTRLTYQNPTLTGFKLEIGLFDPIALEDPTRGRESTPIGLRRFEGEASYAATFGEGRVRAFLGGLWREAQTPGPDRSAAAPSWGAAGGLMLGWSGRGLAFSGYTGEGPGSTFGFDESAVDALGGEQAHKGWLAQATYEFDGQTKLGGSYGRSIVGESAADRVEQLAGVGYLGEQQAWTVGVYHDVTSWLKLAAEYSNVERSRLNERNEESDVFAIGGFISW